MGAHQDMELGAQKGPCCLHITTTTPCCPPQSCRTPSPPALLGFHPCSHFECNTSPGCKKNPAGETLLLESKENYRMETLPKGPREGNAQEHVVKEHLAMHMHEGTSSRVESFASS